MSVYQQRRQRKSEKENKLSINNSRTQTKKSKAQEEYAEVTRNVKESIRADNRNYPETLATEAEEVAHQNRNRTCSHSPIK
ncbi:hypothetical protein DPMN_155382 [Dreissena polymorpha]|uniref:Uncharacterized protein n=1 Tax=Dreissena polymorpha TaxID=45954 RepID=A0A9D4FPC1_DREPO|nr:hypothetical protein DPMN_155382 [Dreissena polymorpha]